MIDERVRHRGGGAQTARADPVVVQRCRRGRTASPGGAVGQGLPSTTVVAADQVVLSIGSNLATGWPGCNRLSMPGRCGVCGVSGFTRPIRGAVSTRAVPQCGGRRGRSGCGRPTTGCGEPQDIERVPTRGSAIGTGARALDVDLVSVRDSSNTEVFVSDDRLSLPHPLAHPRAFVMIPWLAVEPDAERRSPGVTRPVGALIAAIGPG